MATLIVVVFALAACGEQPTASEKAPRIPSGVAERMADLSDETAAALEAGDGCAAEASAAQLEAEARDAEDRIPAELRPEVRRGVEQLASAISCVPAPVLEPEPKEKKDEKKDEKKEKDPKHEHCPPGWEKHHWCDEHGHDGDHGPGGDQDWEWD